MVQCDGYPEDRQSLHATQEVDIRRAFESFRKSEKDLLTELSDALISGSSLHDGNDMGVKHAWVSPVSHAPDSMIEFHRAGSF